MIGAWLETRQQVAIAGQVVDLQTGLALAGAQVQIDSAPQAFITWLARRAIQYGADWSTMARRPDRTSTDPDGYFNFLDLPGGDYALVASLPNFGSRYGTAEAKATVAIDSKTGTIAMASTPPIMLPPTTIKGTVTTAGKKPLVLAEVRVRGSGESAFSDSQGNYCLAGLETSKGTRILVAMAPGYRETSTTVSLQAAGSVVQQDFSLTAVAL